MQGAPCPSRDLPWPWALPGQRTAGCKPEPCASICGVCRQVTGGPIEWPTLVCDLLHTACRGSEGTSSN